MSSLANGFVDVFWVIALVVAVMFSLLTVGAVVALALKRQPIKSHSAHQDVIDERLAHIAHNSSNAA